MIQFLGFLKNPIFKFAAEKTMGAINHKLQKDKIIKEKELEESSEVEFSSEASFDDYISGAYLENSQ